MKNSIVMKKRYLLLTACCLITRIAGAQDPSDDEDPGTFPFYNSGKSFGARFESDVLTEKLYVTATTPDDPYPFLLNTSTADVWKFSPFGTEWVYLGDPRGGGTGRPGKYTLTAYETGRVLVLDTTTGEAWLVDGSQWVPVEEPSSRATRYKGSSKTWNEMWELFKRQSKDAAP